MEAIAFLVLGMLLGTASPWERWGKRWKHEDDDDKKRDDKKRDDDKKRRNDGEDVPPEPPPKKAATPSFPLDPLPAGATPYNPPPAPVVARAFQLLSSLAPGKVSKEADPTQRYAWVAYRKEPHGGGKVGITAYRSKELLSELQKKAPPPEAAPPVEEPPAPGYGKTPDVPVGNPPPMDPRDPNWGKPPWERDGGGWPGAGGGISTDSGSGEGSLIDRAKAGLEQLLSGEEDYDLDGDDLDGDEDDP